MSGDQQHTAGPWREGVPADAIVADGDAQFNGNKAAVDYYGGQLVAESVSPANRRRILACVNYCDGAITDGLEDATKIGGLQEYTRRASQAARDRDTYHRQRDQMKVALELLLVAAQRVLRADDGWNMIIASEGQVDETDPRRRIDRTMAAIEQGAARKDLEKAIAKAQA